jgi:hypothetical protein
MEQSPIFIPIKGYETYAVDINGNIKDLRTGKLKKLYKNPQGYRVITLLNENGNSTQQIHRLIAIHFIPNPDKLPEIDHINRIRDDNRIENLRWVNDYTQAVNKLWTNSKYKKYIHLEDTKTIKNPNPSWKITIRNHLCKFRKRYSYCDYEYEEIIKFRNEILTLHNIPILD